MRRKEEIQDRIDHLHSTLGLVDLRVSKILEEIRGLRKERVRVDFEENLVPVFESCSAEILYFSREPSYTLKFEFKSLDDSKLSTFKNFIQSNGGTDRRVEIFLDEGKLTFFYQNRAGREKDSVSVTIRPGDYRNLENILENELSSVRFTNVDDRLDKKSDAIKSKADSIKCEEEERKDLERLRSKGLL